MGNRGRFGKYGEQKRIGRLRDVGKTTGFNAHKAYMKESRRITRYDKEISRKPRVTIRPGVASDANYVEDLSGEVFQQYGPYEDILPQWLDSAHTVTLMALMGKRPVGFVMLGTPGHRWEIPGRCELLGIAVAPDSQGLGVADILLEEIIKSANELHIERMVLHTAVLNLPGRSLFNKHGFFPAGIKKAFYPEGQDAVMMYKDLFSKGPLREIMVRCW